MCRVWCFGGGGDGCACACGIRIEGEGGEMLDGRDGSGYDDGRRSR